MGSPSLRKLQKRLALIVIVYFFAGSASQKLMPFDIDEVFPFFGWSLFTKVPNEEVTYTLRIDEHDGVAQPGISFLRAPGNMVVGDRYIARKVIQHLGKATFRGETEEVLRQRQLLEDTWLRGQVRYRLVREVYDPLLKWRTGENREESVLATFESSPATSGDAVP